MSSLNKPWRRQNIYPVFTSGLLHTRLAMAAYAVAGPTAADSAEVSWTMAARELITGGHDHSKERGKQEYILHFDGLRELAKVLQRGRMSFTGSL